MSQITGSICDVANSCQQIVLNISEQVNSGYDYAYLGKVWTTAFSSVLMLYLFSLGIGQIIRLVKHA
ncbi:hypothetical protein NBY25_25095 (plasmid) [Escherichia coli]|jgi:hypothetical protein|uniref:hypothetical protein n=1 Tax=Enterobacteriaceae TaxID=543 RepID=UPI00158805D0|nr:MULTISPECIES: hypothetical protein [Enterobacteriaceae]HAK8251397.1 hypothetical protein [Salmonella enterica]EKF7120724.1 hypothetical protein [Escherichia coli]MBS9691171.1 hypothetical protein [Escherichia coli]MBU8927973.1 hypothetical protein [Enterobacter hormaechei]MBU8932332.1 hypothetical protein [Enterobacter hormaechei]